MGATSRERYAVVSCHVERPLDDAVWARFSALQEARPGGFAVAALMRPADPRRGEDEAAWLARAREAAGRGPLGHHTHWTAPDHARPLAADPPPTPPAEAESSLVTYRHKGVPADPAAEEEPLVTDRHDRTDAAALVREEGRRLREAGLRPTLFCGGGWYTDVEVAEACAELQYVDCTPRASRPSYLADGERWAELSEPAHVQLPSGRELRAIPTTHTIGDLARALTRRQLPRLVHAYFHDTDLLDGRRRAFLYAGLRVLCRRAEVLDLDALAERAFPEAQRIAWDDVARL